MAIQSGCTRRETPVVEGNRTQVLHRGIGHDLASLDPHLATQASDYNVLSALFEGLVAEDPVDLHPVPGVAESWTFDAESLAYTFKLRGNARWSNGDPVTAADFIASFRRALTPSLAADNATLLHLIKGAEAFAKGQAEFSAVGLAAPDSRTLRIALEKPAPYFLAQLNHPVWFPVHLPSLQKSGAPADRTNNWAQPGRLVGNGPFTLREWKSGQRIVVDKSATYWDAAAVRLREIHFHTIEGDAEERAFRAGQLHLTDALPAGKVETYRRESPHLLRIDPLLGTYFYRVNVATPFLNEARVRRALSLAVDRAAIVEKLLGAGQKPAHALTPPGTAGYTFDSRRAAGQGSELPGVGNLEKARELLAAAGYAGGRGLPVFEILYNNSDNHRLIAEAIQEMWRTGLGVEVRLASQELTGTLEARRTGKYQLLRSVWIGDFNDPLNFLGVFAGGSGNNHTGWSDSAYDSLLRAASLTVDPAARNGLYQQAEAILLEAAPLIPIYHYTHVFAIQPSVKGWHPTILDHHPYKAVWLE